MAYSKTGPFVNNSAPGIDQTFLNKVENYLNAGVANSGVPLISKIATVSVNGQFGTTVNHNLHDANGANITPDIVLLVFPNKQGLHAASYDTLTSTQVTLYADVVINVAGIALKF